VNLMEDFKPDDFQIFSSMAEIVFRNLVFRVLEPEGVLVNIKSRGPNGNIGKASTVWL